MESNYLYVIAGLLPPCFVLISWLRYFGHQVSKFLTLVKVKPLSLSAEVGDQIRFTGKMIYPITGSEIFGVQSSVWRLLINGEFTSKAKKPRKGTVTHRPRIYESSNDHELITLANSDWTVHPIFPAQSKYIVKPKIIKKKMRFLSGQNFKEILKPKYKGYILKQIYIPARVQVCVLGQVVTKSGRVVTVTGDGSHDNPAFIFNGSFASLVGSYIRNMMILLMVIGGLIGACYFYWSAIDENLNIKYVVGIWLATVVLYGIKKGLRL